MVRIRLRRIGSKKQPSYRIVITDKRNARDSRYLENIGFYNPRTQPHTVNLDEERAMYWLSVGAQPSKAGEQLLKETGTLARFTRFRAGEDMEALIAEAKAEQEAAEPISPKTFYQAASKPVDAKLAEVVADNIDEIEAAAEEA